MAEEDIKTTRLELIETRGRVVLAEKGHNLLKQKQDVLILEFFKILGKAKDLRNELNTQMTAAFQGLAVAEAYHGIHELEAVALAVKTASGINVQVKNVMGVKIPEIRGRDVKKTLTERGYSVVGTSAKIDEAASAFEGALEMVIKLGETENALKRLVREIEKTKRRVNSLEFILIPRLKEKVKIISMRLEGLERDQFIALKIVKKKIAAKKAA
ncbi:MAG TPA: V-type ATP synthase subunit D [Candidatus Diapherotrites archaeon]|uniref:A-type ATP synthase subunit D n=1 Tax=Candidatus Iainarchaeum sp. TaxID=3101447 RepID=A0A7J4JFZ4_9ARCH|nr:V-type ATP synthase subunit D [Candidatus Diapherotrites archaeon]HIH16683.1 V-type ATP synthase subunit D [Candidatus Diapherotrites archaeon]